MLPRTRPPFDRKKFPCSREFYGQEQVLSKNDDMKLRIAMYHVSRAKEQTPVSVLTNVIYRTCFGGVSMRYSER